MFRTISLFAMAAIAWIPSAAWAQRTRTDLADPGVQISTPGRGSVSTNFRTYSTGVDSIGALGGGSRSSVLRQSLRSRGLGGQVTGGSAYTPPGSAASSGRPGTRRLFTGSSGGIAAPVVANPNAYAIKARQAASRSALARASGSYAYLSGFAMEQDNSLLNSTEPVTSFVPEGSSLYARYMAEGDKAFRAGEYGEAIGRFTLANDLIGDDPESLLSLMHCHFAGDPSMEAAGFYLRKALRVMPELPTAPIQPAGFFGDENAYRRKVHHVAEQVKDTRVDADACLVLAYARWFEGDVKGASEALRKAVAVAPDYLRERVTESAEIFWRGMVATGKVTGPLIEGTEADEPDEPIDPAEQAEQPRPGQADRPGRGDRPGQTDQPGQPAADPAELNT
jgi:hypothetical protein